MLREDLRARPVDAERDLSLGALSPMEDTDGVVGGFLSLQIEEASVWVGKQERRPPYCKGVRAETIPVSGCRQSFIVVQRRQQLRKGCLYTGDGMEKPPYRTVPE